MAATTGELRYRMDAQVRSQVDDGYGNTQAGPFATQGSFSAKIQFLRGGETVMADRLTGKQPAIITIRSSAFTRSLDTAWRLVDSSGNAWNIRAITDPNGKRAWLEILAEKGVVT